MPLEDCCEFVERVKFNKRNGMNNEAAFYEAYKHCAKTRPQMKGFLDEHEWELFDMIITEYNEEWDKEAQRKYYTERGREQGIKRGRTEEKLDMVRNLLTTNLPLKEISRVARLPEEEILKLSKE